jgi:formiminotetrahydrofolate cyclodeaminase
VLQLTPIFPLQEFTAKLRQLTEKCFELFRHYWACFPLTKQTEKQTEAKLTRIVAKLEEAYNEVKQVRATCRDQMAHLYELTRPLEQSLDNIFNLETKRNVHHLSSLSPSCLVPLRLL